MNRRKMVPGTIFTPGLLLRAGLVVALLAQAACLPVHSATRDEYRSLGMERLNLEPAYEPLITAAYSEQKDFSKAELLVRVSRQKTCRTQVLNVREKVRYTERSSEHPEYLWAEALLALGAGICAGTQFSDAACISETTDDETGQKVPLSDEARRNWGIGFGTVAAVTATAFIVELTRLSDEEEVIATERKPLNIEEFPCGDDPHPNAVIIFEAANSDDPPVRVRTNSQGLARLKLVDLPLYAIAPDEPIGTLRHAENSSRPDQPSPVPIKVPPLRPALRASKQAYESDRLLSDAKNSASARLYYQYLRTLPDPDTATDIHQEFIRLVLENDLEILKKDELRADMLQRYLKDFADQDAVKSSEQPLNERMWELRVEQTARQYIEAWAANDAMQGAEIRRQAFIFDENDDENDAARALLDEKLLAYHRARIDEITEQSGEKNTTADGSTEDTEPEDKELHRHYEASLAFIALLSSQQSENSESGSSESPKKWQDQARLVGEAYAGLLRDDAARRAAQSSEPGDDAVIEFYKRALDLELGESARAQTNQAYLSYIADSMRVEARDMIARDCLDCVTLFKEERLRVWFEVPTDAAQSAIIDEALIDACADLAEAAIKSDELDTVAVWDFWLWRAEEFAVSRSGHASADERWKQRASNKAASALKKRRQSIEKQLQRRYPPDKLQTLEEAVVIYPPTIPSEGSRVATALSAPRKHLGARIVVKLQTEQRVGDRYLARTASGQQVFLYSSNPRVHKLLRVNQSFNALAIIDKPVNYRREGGATQLPQLNIIWAKR